MINFFCIGRNNVDIYLKYNKVYPGGNCSNVAAHLARFGHRASLVTVVGNDLLGQLQLGSLRKLGVDVSASRVEEGQTAWCCIMHQNGNRKFVKSDLSIFADHLMTEKDVSHVSNQKYDAIYTSTCIGGFFQEGVFESLGNYHLPVCCDFADKWKREELYDACSYIQYPYLSCEKYTLEETIEVLSGCVEHGAKLALGTRGMEGSVVYNGRKFYHQCAYDAPIIDTLGAGDSFLARFSMCYFEGKKQLERAKYSGEVETRQMREDGEDRLIEYSLTMASLYATHVCGYYGGYGEGIDFHPVMISKGKWEENSNEANTDSGR